MNKDQLLIQKLAKGDLMAFEELYRNYYPRVINFSNSLLNSREDAEEVAQDVFVKLWNARTKLDSNQSASTFIFRIARFTTIDKLRKNKGIIFETALDHVISYAPIEESIMLKELEKILGELIERLPEKRKEIFLMSRKLGMSHKEIAEKLNISPKTVEAQIRSSLKSLREELSKNPDYLVLVAMIVPFKYFF